MKKYYISRNAQNVITYGVTEFDGVISSEGTTFETFTDETSWKQQIAHYQSLFPQDIDMAGDPNWPVLPDEDLFPYPTRPIRVFITHQQVTAMIESPYKPLIDYALSVPYQKSDAGITLWLENFGNAQMTAEQVREILEGFGAIINIKSE
jgi:hypothetical protein